MNIAVRYYSRSGNTGKVAEAIAAAAGVTAEDCSVPISEPVDLLFLGGSIYAGGIDEKLQEYIAKLDGAKVKRAAVFATSALKKEPEGVLVAALREKGIPVAKHTFHCRGAFAVVHRSHPDGEDLKRAADFAKAVIAGVPDGD